MYVCYVCVCDDTVGHFSLPGKDEVAERSSVICPNKSIVDTDDGEDCTSGPGEVGPQTFLMGRSSHHRCVSSLDELLEN